MENFEQEQERNWESESSRILDYIEKSTGNDKELREAYNDVKIGVDRYVSYKTKVRKNAELSEESKTKQDSEESDRLQKAIHDALIDKINILSRMEGERGIDNSWRKSWGELHTLTERKAIAAWAEDVAPEFQMELEAKEEEEKAEKLAKLKKK